LLVDMCSVLDVEIQFVGTVDQVICVEHTDIGGYLTPFFMCASSVFLTIMDPNMLFRLI
jgi:hypothetical protein